jgi:hypothetical protein
MNTILAIALLSMLAIGPPAPPPAAPAQPDAFTAEDRKQALEALKSIAQAFDEKQGQPAPAPQGSGKNMADVADKALDFSVKYIGQAAAIVEKAAPHVWAVMIRQQYAKALGEVTVPFLWIAMVIIATAVVRHSWRVDVEATSDEQAGRVVVTLVIPVIACLFAGGFFIYDLANSIMYIINPEYYAIRDLVQILLHPGTL